MARPKKFRIPLEEVTQSDNARKVAGHVAEIEFFRKQIADLQEHIADVYDAADEDGFDKKFIRLAVARRAKDPDAAKAVEAGVDTYEEAIDLGFSSRARVENLEHDADGVIIEQGPADRSAGSVALPADTQSTAARMDVPGSLPVIENGPVLSDNGGRYPVNGEAKVLAASSEVPGTPAGTQAPPVDTHSPADKSLGKAGAEPRAPSNVVPMKRQPTFSDKPHKDCLNPEQCGGFSNLGLCPKCKVAAGIDVDAVRVPLEGKIGR